MTVLEVLQRTTEFFKKRKIENARLNAEHLLAHSLGKKRLDLYLEFERVLDETELTPLRDLVRRRGEGEPLQHLLGTAEFCGRTFICDKRGLVPRPETEELVELLRSKIEDPKSKILDVGTGSGVIALSLAAVLPDAKITAADVSSDALALARENAQKLGLADRVRFVESDMFSGVTERFDVIAANLPYVAQQDGPSLAREVLHDPEIALFGGAQGDELIRVLIEQAPAQLQPNGLLALEIGLGQSEGLIELLRLKNYHDIDEKKDYQNIPRFLLARYG